MAAKTITEVIDALQVKVATVAALRTVPDTPLGKIGAWPASIAYPGTGNVVTGEFGINYTLHNIICEIHYPRKDLSRDVEALLALYDPFIVAVTDDPWLSENCETFTGISYTFGPMQYAAEQTIGWRFVIENLKMYPYGVKGSA